MREVVGLESIIGIWEGKVSVVKDSIVLSTICSEKKGYAYQENPSPKKF